MKGSNKQFKRRPKKRDAFDAHAFLDSAGVAKKVRQFKRAEIVFGNATATTFSTVLVIDKKEMLNVLHKQHDLSDLFINFVLRRNIRVEEDLVDQLFNSTEKRLARTLLLLARYGKQDQPQGVLPKVSQETLAEMIGTTRTRVNLFMNKFKKLGFIRYNGGIEINTSLLSVVLHD